MESLLSLLMEAEAQMNEGMAGMDKRERPEKDSNQLTQQLSLCKASSFKPEPKLYISFPFFFLCSIPWCCVMKSYYSSYLPLFFVFPL